MNRHTRDILLLVVGVAVVALIGVGGYLAMHARASGSGSTQDLAPVVIPSTSASASPQAPPYERWMVGKVIQPVAAYAKPSASAKVVTRMDKVNQNGYPSLVLVDKTREVKGKVWYKVWLAVRPNGTTGWVPEGKLAFYTTSAKITIDLSARKLTVQRRGEVIDSYKVAVGRPDLSTPTGFFFINQKLKPPTPDGAYGVLAIGISAFQMKLAATDWIQGGPVAIHGTNEPWLIGKAISHGCVRMHNKDVLAVSRLVPAGSPVEIVK
jgi:lipoprotein-anchoring transpeptidase ErfK/SrfK